MTRRTRIGSGIGAIAAIAALCAWWTLRAPTAHPRAGDGPEASTAGSASASLRPVRPPRLALPFPSIAGDTDVVLSGRVLDLVDRRVYAGVEVVFLGPTGGMATATTGADGGYELRLAAGSYQAFVRSDTVLSIGRAERIRLPGLPLGELAGAPDHALMTQVSATGDADGIDLFVVRSGTVSGRVVDPDGRPVAGAVLRARGDGVRPALATDIAESGVDGSFELRLPAGSYELEASHPRFAGLPPGRARFAIRRDEHQALSFTLATGCVIAGRVIGGGGKPSGDGAIERQLAGAFGDFIPAGRVEPDGTFRWATTSAGDVVLRAWPWQSPPSPTRRFACRDGARFTDVVFELPDRQPDLEGILVDQAGQPVAFAHVDFVSLDPNGVDQQERTDGAGRWAVYDAAPGRYRVTAQADGRGITAATLVSPRDGVRLELGGTGALAGTTARLARGSFELVLESCLDNPRELPIPWSKRLVTVTGGRFRVDGLPACQLVFSTHWNGQLQSQQITIPSGGTARIELDIGPPRPKTVHGRVRDSQGQPVAGALVTATSQGNTDATTRTGEDGGYTIKTSSGASLRASLQGQVGYGQVGAADIDTERVDLAIQVIDEDRESQ